MVVSCGTPTVGSKRDNIVQSERVAIRDLHLSNTGLVRVHPRQRHPIHTNALLALFSTSLEAVLVVVPTQHLPQRPVHRCVPGSPDLRPPN